MHHCNGQKLLLHYLVVQYCAQVFHARVKHECFYATFTFEVQICRHERIKFNKGQFKGNIATVIIVNDVHVFFQESSRAKIEMLRVYKERVLFAGRLALVQVDLAENVRFRDSFNQLLSQP